MPTKTIDVEKVLLKATGAKPRDEDESTQAYRRRIAEAVNEISDEKYQQLPEPALEWCAAAVKAAKASSPLPPFRPKEDADAEAGDASGIIKQNEREAKGLKDRAAKRRAERDESAKTEDGEEPVQSPAHALEKRMARAAKERDAEENDEDGDADDAGNDTRAERVAENDNDEDTADRDERAADVKGDDEPGETVPAKKPAKPAKAGKDEEMLTKTKRAAERPRIQKKGQDSERVRVAKKNGHATTKVAKRQGQKSSAGAIPKLRELYVKLYLKKGGAFPKDAGEKRAFTSSLRQTSLEQLQAAGHDIPDGSANGAIYHTLQTLEVIDEMGLSLKK